MRRLHPASAIFRALSYGSVGLGVGAVVSGALVGILADGFDLVAILLAAALTIVLVAAGVGFGVLQYLRFEYDVSDETVSLAHGVLARTERDIPFGRIQNVDIRRGLLARALGVATVNLETAGGGSTEAVLNVVALAEAERIQDAVAGYDRIAEESTDAGETVAGDRSDADAADPDEASADRRGPPERETLFELSTEDLALLSAVSFDPSGVALLIFSIPFGQEFAFEFLARTVAALGGPTLPSLEALSGLPSVQLAFVLFVAAVQFLFAAWAASAIVTAVKFYDFRLAKVGDDLRYERGLLQRYTGTIPLEKVQTVTVRENVAMRRFGYAGLDLETAGYGPSQDGSASNTAIPLDDRDVVIALAERLGDVEYPTVERPPKRTRRRYAVRFALLPIALTVVTFAVDRLVFSLPRWWLPLLALGLAPVAGHYAWKHRGYALTDPAFVARSGFWRRHTRIVPYYRVQTVIDSRSVFQRWRSLASVTADTASTASLVGGDATAYDVDEGTAIELHRTLRDRLADDLGRRRAQRRGAGRGTDASGDATGSATS